MDIENFKNKDIEMINDNRYKVVNALQNKGFFGYMWVNLGLDIPFWFWSDIVFSETSFRAEVSRILMKAKVVSKNIKIQSSDFDLNVDITI